MTARVALLVGAGWTACSLLLAGVVLTGTAMWKAQQRRRDEAAANDFAEWEAEGAEQWRPGLYEIGLGGTD